MTEQNRLIWRKNYKTQFFSVTNKKRTKTDHKKNTKQNKTNSTQKKEESISFYSSHSTFGLPMWLRN